MPYLAMASLLSTISMKPSLGQRNASGNACLQKIISGSLSLKVAQLILATREITHSVGLIQHSPAPCAVLSSYYPLDPCVLFTA